MKVLTFSRFFPKGHPKAGQPTLFIEQILNSILPRPLTVGLDEFPPAARDYINDFYVIDGTRQKHTTIRAGARFKPGDMASLRVWSDKPYRSKQIEFAQVEVKKTWAFEISDGNYSINNIQIGSFVPDLGEFADLASNDGLSIADFYSWFAVHPKKKEHHFTGQIICWSDKINY